MSTFLPFLGIMGGALSSHQFGPGFKSQYQRHMWVEFVVGSLPCSKRGFSPGTPQKPTFPNSNSTSNQVEEVPQSGCAASKSLFILFIRSFVRLLDLSLSTRSPYCPFFFFHYQAQKKERFTNVQKRIQASFSKLTM